MTNERYLILGASSDVGLRLVQNLLSQKENITIFAQYCSNDAQLKQLDAGRNVLKCVQADFSDEQSVADLIQICGNELSVPTHIVHLPAEKFEYMRFKAFDWQKFHRDMEIQVHSIVEILKAFLPKMGKEEIYSKIVFMLTAYTLGNPPQFMTHYVMNKYMLLGLMKSLAAEYQGKKISINGISPSMIETKFLSNIDSRVIEMNSQKSVGRKNAQVEDIVPVIEFLLSQDSNYLNGVNLNVSNGNY